MFIAPSATVKTVLQASSLDPVLPHELLVIDKRRIEVFRHGDRRRRHRQFSNSFSSKKSFVEQFLVGEVGRDDNREEEGQREDGLPRFHNVWIEIKQITSPCCFGQSL